MSTLLLFGPCEVFNDIVMQVDCTQRVGMLGFFFILLSLIALYVLGDAIYRGRIPFASQLTKWIHHLKEKGLHNLEAWELCVIGLPIGLYLYTIAGVLAGFDTDTLIILPVPLVILFGYKFYLLKEIQNPHKDLPEEVRAMTEEQLKEYNRKLELLITARKLRSDGTVNIFESAHSMKEIEQDYLRALKYFPQFKQIIEDMRETQIERVKEKI